MSSFVRTVCITTGILFFVSDGIAQVFNRGFRITNNRAKRVAIPFELQSNLIIIPVRMNNGEELKFILDTGVRTAILTNGLYVEGVPSVNDRMISLMGAGNAGEVSAYVSIERQHLDDVLDLKPQQHGRYMGGNHVSLVPPTRLVKDQAVYVLILSWIFAEEIM